MGPPPAEPGSGVRCVRVGSKDDDISMQTQDRKKTPHEHDAINDFGGKPFALPEHCGNINKKIYKT